MQDPTVSIVINNYNYGRYIAAAINSALNQTYRHVEVIIVDDGSTDQSREVIEPFGSRARCVFRENGGQAAAVNTGYALSSGDIVLFLDSDDALKTTAVEHIVQAWRPGVSKCQYSLIVVDGGGRPLGSVFPRYPATATAAALRHQCLLTGSYICPPSTGNAYSRDYLERIMPLPTDQFIGSDAPLTAVAPLYGDVVSLDRPLAYYRVHGSNRWLQSSLRAERFAKYVADDLKRFRYLCDHARALGLEVADTAIERSLHHLHHRLASAKLVPELHPLPEETPWSVVRAAIAAAKMSDLESHRLMVTLAWFVTVAAAPAPLAAWLITARFIPARRSRALTWLLNRTGLVTGANGWEGNTAFEVPEDLCAT